MGGTVNAIQVLPDKPYLGSDGSFSTFKISVGNPPQQVNVLPSTLVPSTWVVLSNACGLDDFPNCEQLRGGLFTLDESKSREPVNTFTLGVETGQGWSDTDAGDFGYDNVTLAVAEGTLPIEHTVVAGVTTNDVYVGVLGLAARDFKLGNDTASSLLSNLRSSNKIPSLSYSYTAGSTYNDTLGSLTLGGYDQSLFNPNSVNFQFGPDEEEYLSVGLQSVSFTGSDGKSTTLLSDAITVNIDSTISAFWLPNDTCNAIASAYGLQFNSLNQLYTLNSSQHDLNLKNNPQLSVQLGNTVANGPSVAIHLPYDALWTNYSDPNHPQADAQLIFSLRLASSSSQFTLGRALLQEAVLTVDFERKNFSIAQVLPTSGTQSQIVSIISPSDESSSGGGGTSTTNPSSPSSTAVTTVSTSSSSSSSFPTGAIAGIVIAVVAIVAGVLAFLWFRRRKDHGSAEVAPAKLPPELGDAKTASGGHYVTIQESKSNPPAYVEVNELDSPKLLGTTVDAFQPPTNAAIPRDSSKFHELPTQDAIGSELHSRSVSTTSSNAPQTGFSPLVELSDRGRLSSPTATSHAEGAWGGSHMEASSPESAYSINVVRPAGRAHLVSHGKQPRSPRHGSPQSSVDHNGMSATIGSFEESRGLGIFPPHNEIQRKHSQRSSRNSQTTLVGGLSGRASPDAGIGTNGSMTTSAFHSPELMPIQHPSAHVTMFPGSQTEVTTPSEIDEGPR